jgi:hypothetical protein
MTKGLQTSLALIETASFLLFWQKDIVESRK